MSKGITKNQIAGFEPVSEAAPRGWQSRLRAVRHLLNQRPDTEHEQLLTRLLILLFLILFGVILASLGQIPGGLSNPAFLIAPVLLVFDVLQLVWIIRSPGVNHYRRSASIVLDVVATTLATHLVGLWGLSIGFVYVVLIMSNGQHFGPRYLVFSAAVSQVAILINLSLTPYLQEHLPTVLLGLFSLTVIPIYHLALTTRLSKAIAERQELVALSIHAEEDQRQQIAADLHDKIGQDLTAVRYYARLIRKLSDGDRNDKDYRSEQDSILTYTKEIQKIGQKMQSSVSGMLKYLWPEALDELGLSEALKEMISGLEQQCPEMKWRLASQPCLDSNRQRDICLYRIVQEACTNIVRHANATIAVIRAGRWQCDVDGISDVILEVSDNGTGFETDSQRNGFGLRGMQERAAAIGGKLEIDSVKGQGTTVRVRVPMLEQLPP